MTNEPWRMSGRGHGEEKMQRKVTSFCLEQESHEGLYVPRAKLTIAGSFLSPSATRADRK